MKIKVDYSKSLKDIAKQINSERQYFHSDFKETKGKGIKTIDIKLVKFDKFMTNEEAIKAMDKKGLRMATFIELATLVEKNPDLFEKNICTINEKDNLEYLAFHRWFVKRSVDCDRIAHEWDDFWWFAGVRKLP